MIRCTAILALVLCLPLLSGCTALVATAGEYIPETLRKHPSRQTVDKMLGHPIRVVLYDKPVPGMTGAEYHFRGRAEDEENFQALGMVSGLTFLTGEVITFPYSLFLSAELSRHVHDYFVTFDENGKCISYSHEDLGESPGQ